MIFTALFWGMTHAQESYSWKMVYALIAQKFPSVPEITARALQERLSRHEVIVIDVRTREEYRIGHIENAKHHSSIDDVIAHYAPTQELVFYCSVGYRSAEMIEKLRTKGFLNAYNLKGSIFMWANSGHNIYRGEKEVHTVHPYSSVWGSLLDKKYHAYTY